MFASATRRQQRRVHLSELTLGTKEMMYKEQRKLDEKLEKIEAQRSRAKRHLEAKERVLKHELDLQVTAQKRMTTFIGAHTGRFREDDLISDLDWETLISLPDAQGLSKEELSRIFMEITGKPPEIRRRKRDIQSPWQPDFLHQRSKTFHGTTEVSGSSQTRPSTTAQYVDGLILQRNLTFIPTNEECKETCRVAWGGLPKIKGINPLFISAVKETVEPSEKEVKPKVRVPKALKIRLRALQKYKKLSFKRQSKLSLVGEDRKDADTPVVVEESSHEISEILPDQVDIRRGDKPCTANRADDITDRTSNHEARAFHTESMKVLWGGAKDSDNQTEEDASNVKTDSSHTSEVNDFKQTNETSDRNEDSRENDKKIGTQDTLNKVFKKGSKQNLWKEITMNVMLKKRKENEKKLKMSDLVQMLAKVKLAKLTEQGNAHTQYTREGGLDKGAFFRARQKYISSNRHLLARRNSGLQYGPQNRRRVSREEERGARQAGYDTWTMQKMHTVMQNSQAYKEGVTQSPETQT
ncbi:uncharacterized protein LOC106168735 [Lingula anatina]|uniref:Uncharacterized protein LOC106168735 n=1 Tax=Lingula anatina TaxID=7574 RepID=A0A1S3IZE1_LINAN|nr:uncharacterized protein LOC106168735 [Lingula anatina]|eukprot:XP_013403356.1 uncharacterized protein LOC106168735 [Lingula anatina]